MGGCRGSVVVDAMGRVVCCTAGCRPVGAAHALSTHRRFVPEMVLWASLVADDRLRRALRNDDDLVAPPTDRLACVLAGVDASPERGSGGAQGPTVTCSAACDGT